MAITQFVITIASLAVFAQCGVIMYDTKLVPEECLKNRAIDGNYTPQGELVMIGDLPVYQAPEPSSPDSLKRMLIGVYDIFGHANPNMKQVTDEMSRQRGGFRAILPDFYRGDSWDPANFPPEDPNDLAEWLARVGNWELVVKPDLMEIVDHYKAEGVEEFAIFGMCWGGKVATLASTELNTLFKAAAMVHPASVANSEADGVKIPMYLMPTANEPDMLPFYQVLQQKFGNNTGHRRFDDMFHGFSGARGNFSNPINQQRVNEVISTLGLFFDRNTNQDQP